MDPLRLTFDELLSLLADSGVDAKKLRAWIAADLPWQQPAPARGKKPLKKFDPKTCWFDEEQVADWLEAKGLGEEPPNVLVKTQNEVAKHLGVTDKTVQTWIAKGAPGKSEWGFYDCDAIGRWYEDFNARKNSGSDAHETRAKHEAERARIRKEREQLELDELKGRLIDISHPVSWNQRAIAEWRATLEDFADLMLSHIPANVRGAWKKSLRENVVKEIKRKFEDFANTMLGWADELEKERREAGEQD